MGHLAEAFVRIEPAVRTLVVPMGIGGEPDRTAWWNERSGPLAPWLQQNLRADDIPGLDLVVWEAARRIDPSRCAELEAAAAETILRVRSELATVGSFGRLWIRNALIHSLTIDAVYHPLTVDSPVSVVAAGPSLEWSRVPDGPVIAVASAMAALTDRDIKPSLWVHLDGGFWAGRYLAAHGTTPVALSIRAARLRPRRARPVLMALNWLGEALAPDAATWLPVGEAPTVTLAAVAIASLISGPGPVNAVGADFASYGLRMHARPNRTDDYRRALATRTVPYASAAFAVVAGGSPAGWRWNDGVTAWQSDALRSYAEECRSRLRPVPSKQNGTSPGVAKLRFLESARPGRRERRLHAAETLRTWRDRAGDPPEKRDDTLRDVALHLAPTEYVAFLSGRVSWDSVTARLIRRLDALAEIAS